MIAFFLYDESIVDLMPQGLRAYRLSVNPRATLKPAWIEVADSNALWLDYLKFDVRSNALQKFLQTKSVLSVISKLYFEQLVAISLVCCSIFIEYKKCQMKGWQNRIYTNRNVMVRYIELVRG